MYLRISLDHPLHRRVAPRICSLARSSRPVPGVKRGSAATPSLLTSTSAPPSSSAYDSRHVAGAHCSGSAQKHLREQPAICTVPVAFHAVVLVAELTARSSASLRLCSGTTTSTADRTAPPQVPSRYRKMWPLNRGQQVSTWSRATSLWSMMSTSSVPTIGRGSTAVEEELVVETAKAVAPRVHTFFLSWIDPEHGFLLDQP